MMNKREYIQENRNWLIAKSQEEGVKALPKGVFYKVLCEGNQESPKPTARSIVTAHYTGKTINGKRFDSSRGGVPLACRLCDLIEGWNIPCNRCTSETSGRYIFLLKWDMASFPSQAFRVGPPWSLR